MEREQKKIVEEWLSIKLTRTESAMVNRINSNQVEPLSDRQVIELINAGRSGQ